MEFSALNFNTRAERVLQGIAAWTARGVRKPKEDDGMVSGTHLSEAVYDRGLELARLASPGFHAQLPDFEDLSPMRSA